MIPLGYADISFVTNSTIDCSDTNYLFCDDFSDEVVDTVKWNQPDTGNCDELGERLNCPSNGGSWAIADSMRYETIYKVFNTSDFQFVMEFDLNSSSVSNGLSAGFEGSFQGGNEHDYVISNLGGLLAVMPFVGSGALCDVASGQTRIIQLFATSTSTLSYLCYDENGGLLNWVNNTENPAHPLQDEAGFFMNSHSSDTSMEYMIAWKGDPTDAPYLSPPASPIVNSSWNATSNNIILGTGKAWNTGGFVNISSNLLSFVVNSSEATNMSCSIGNNVNYTTMVALDSNYKSATTDTTEHAYTVSDNILIGNSCLYCSFIRTDGTGEYNDSHSGCLNINYPDTDTTPPLIFLISPDDLKEYSLNIDEFPLLIDFIFNVTKDSNCSLYIDLVLNDSIDAINNTISSFNNTPFDINTTSKEWYISCDDGLFMTNSDTREFSIVIEGESKIFSLPLDSLQNVFIFFTLAILYLGVMIIAFMFKNFGFGSLGFFLGLILGFLLSDIHIILTFVFLLINIVIFAKSISGFK